jgi:hypothetical protein
VRLLVAVPVLLTIATAPALALETVDEIHDCMEGNLPEKGSIQDVVLRTVDRTGHEVESRAQLWWKRSEEDRGKLLMEISAPPERRGSILLAIQEEEGHTDMWLYLPELRRVKRISERTVSGSLFGTDFTYEDFLRIQHLAKEAESTRLADEVVEDRPVYVLEARPSKEASEYERIKFFIDQEKCVLVRAEHYETGDRLTKLLSSPIEKVTKETSGWVPRLTQMKDLLDNTHTDLVVDKIDTQKEISDRMFSVQTLQRKGR